MRIVVLDGHTLQRDDLSWAALERLGDCTVYAHAEPERTLERAAGAAIVLTNKTPLTRAELEQLPDLRYVGVLATGHDVVDAQAARERGIVVANVPAYSTASVAQATIAMLLALTNRVALHAEASRAGRWSASGEFSHVEAPLIELAGRTLGIVGFGRIGHAVAQLARALGMEVVAATRSSASVVQGVAHVELDALFERADVVSLHCPATPDTIGLVNASRLARMKPGALLINTARGVLIDESALLHALRNGPLGGAALDVLAHEPPDRSHPLLHEPRCLVTPHIAWATRAARGRLMAEAIENVRAFLAGAPRNVVD